MRSGLPLAAVLIALSLSSPAAAKGSDRLNTATYTTFDPLTATVPRANGRRGVLTVQGGLDIKDKALRARASLSGPLLRDAYIRTLSVYGASLSPGAPPDVDQIALRLQRATDQVLHTQGAKVLLGTVIVN